MASINPSISTVTLSVNGLNNPTKRQWLLGWIKNKNKNKTQLEERINEFEDRSFEIIKSEKQKERKNEEKWEKPLSQTSVYIVGVS